MTQEEKAKAYDELIAKLIKAKEDDAFNDERYCCVIDEIVPELKESEGDRIRKSLIDLVNCNERSGYTLLNNVSTSSMLAWLEKQKPIDEDEIVKGIRRGVAISLINHIDANSKGMCLSNMECEDIENAIINEDWDNVYGYMKKKLEQKLADKVEPKNTPQLTEEDIRIIDNIMFDINNELATKPTPHYVGNFYKIVLKRFNEIKEK